MMGEPVGRQDRLFYEFDLEDMVPGDHLLRRIDAVLELSWLRNELAPYYSHTGCPSVDPELLIRMLIVGYCYSIRSERRLCQEVKMNLAYRWFCRLGLEDRVPDHSTFSVNRHGPRWPDECRKSVFLRQVFEEVVCGCVVQHPQPFPDIKAPGNRERSEWEPLHHRGTQGPAWCRRQRSQGVS